MSKRQYTARQQTAALAWIDTQLDALAAALDAINATLDLEALSGKGITPEFDAAWTALTDAQTRLQEERKLIYLNPLVDPSPTAALISANID